MSGASPHAAAGALLTSARGAFRPSCGRTGARIWFYSQKEITMSVSLIVLILVILLLVGALPTWGHSRNWGYGPSGGLGLVLLILVVLLLMGKI
jgi:hypothetical protein